MLDHLDLSIEAAIALAPGSLVPLTTIPLNIVILSRERYDHIFAAQIGPKSDNRVTLDNLQRRAVMNLCLVVLVIGFLKLGQRQVTHPDHADRPPRLLAAEGPIIALEPVTGRAAW